MIEIVENRTAQWYADDYPPKARWDTVRKWLAHSTETPSRSRHGSKLWAWPGYNGGASAPNRTILPDLQGRRLLIRWHFPGNAAARALRNSGSGGETNAVPGGVLQTELVGTCAPAVSRDWQRRGLVPGVDFVEWWRPPGWVLDGLAQVWVADHEKWGVPLVLGSTLWPAYPSSPALDRRARMGRREFEQARGLVGHLHAPENEHLDPGAFPAADLLRRALALKGGTTTPNTEDEMPLTDADVERIAAAVWAHGLRSGIQAGRFAQPAGDLMAWAAAHALGARRAAESDVTATSSLAAAIAAGGADTAAVVEAAREGAAAALSEIRLTTATDGPGDAQAR